MNQLHADERERKMTNKSSRSDNSVNVNEDNDM